MQTKLSDLTAGYMAPYSKKYMVDGELLDEHQVRTVFNNGIVELKRLSNRERIALRMVQEVLPSNGLLLDIGCYAGMFLKQMKTLHPFIEGCGVDYYEDNIAIARLLHPELSDHFYQMSVYSLAFEDESFDCVTFREVIEHIDRPVDALREINRVLRTNGHLIVSTPNANAAVWRSILSEVKRRVLSRLGRKNRLGYEVFFENVEWNRHVYAWTSTILNTLLFANGFEYVDHCFYYHSSLERLLPGMESGMIFLARKTRRAPTHII